MWGLWAYLPSYDKSMRLSEKFLCPVPKAFEVEELQKAPILRTKHYQEAFLTSVTNTRYPQKPVRVVNSVLVTE